MTLSLSVISFSISLVFTVAYAFRRICVVYVSFILLRVIDSRLKVHYIVLCICNAIIRILLNFGYNFNMLLRVFVICYVSFILSVVLVFHYAFKRIICIFIFVYSHVSSLFYMNYFTIGISVYICNFIVGIIMCILKVRLIRY